MAYEERPLDEEWGSLMKQMNSLMMEGHRLDREAHESGVTLTGQAALAMSLYHRIISTWDDEDCRRYHAPCRQCRDERDRKLEAFRARSGRVLGELRGLEDSWNA